ncbi:MAG: carbohydrate ABC transporter permease [Firmicutes bacterium]|nr:carbohydrate ABC transporter permease [Bacillota bacterium]
MIKKSSSRIMFEVFNGVFMTALVAVTLYPLLYVMLASFSEPVRFISHKGFLLRPLGFSTVAYKRAFDHPMIASGFKNTFFIIIVGGALSVLLTSIGAYFMSRKNLMLRKPISFMIIFTMFFGGGLIPFYFAVRNFTIFIPWIVNGAFVFKALNIYNTLFAVIIPVCINTYNLIVLRTGFMSIPDSIEESAKIDGAGHLTVLFKIIMPLAKANIAVITLYYGVGYWNSWFNASIFLADNTLHPLQLVLRQILLINSADSSMIAGVDVSDRLAVGETIKYASIVIATVPILFVYPLLQKYFVKGVMVGAVKG